LNLKLRKFINKNKLNLLVINQLLK
jgi:hypothetical protein